MDNNTALDTLRKGWQTLPTSSQSFAKSLLEQYDRKGQLSDRQWPYVEKLANELSAPEDQPQAPKVDLQPILALFGRVSRKLKRPKLWLRLDNGTDVKLSYAGTRSKEPGSVNVALVTDVEDLWSGRIGTNGVYRPFNLDQKTVTSVSALLINLAADPTKVASGFGHLTGHCCFCSKRLEDPRSTEVGYGPICASNWGLPWG